MWHIYVSIAVLNCNTSCYASSGCEKSRVFDGRIPYNVLDLKLGTFPQETPIPTSKIAQDILGQTEMIHQEVRKKIYRLTSNINLIRTKKPTLQNSKKQIMFTFYNRKQIITGVKFLLRNSDGLGRTLLKRCYQTTIFCWTKLASTRRK